MSVNTDVPDRRIVRRQPGLLGDAKAVTHAFRGLKHMIGGERAFRIQLMVSVGYAAMFFLRQASGVAWVVYFVAISVVLAGETFNTAIERVCDFIHLDDHDEIKLIKDLAAAAELIVSVVALGIGAFIIALPTAI